MGIYTVGGVDIGEDIRLDLGDTDSEDYEWQDADINRFIARAVRLYSRYAPYYKKGELTTVEDQDLYALPSDCVQLVECDYRLSTVPWLTDLDEYDDLVCTKFPYWFQDHEGTQRAGQRRMEANHLHYQLRQRAVRAAVSRARQYWGYD